MCLAVWSLRFLSIIFLVALTGDFIANGKPLYCKVEGVHYFPVLKQYMVKLGLSVWDGPFNEYTSWSELTYEAVLMPPIPYSAQMHDYKNTNCKSPLELQQVNSVRYRHWLGTDKFGRDIAAGMIAGTRTAMLVGIAAMSIASILGIFFGALAGFFWRRAASNFPYPFIIECYRVPARYFLRIYHEELSDCRIRSSGLAGTDEPGHFQYYSDSSKPGGRKIKRYSSIWPEDPDPCGYVGYALN